MAGSNPAGGVVFVTATDYVIVYPTVVIPETTLGQLSTMVTSYRAATSVDAVSTIMTSDSSVTSSISSITGVPALPSKSTSSQPYPKTKLWDDKLASLALTIIILLVIVLLSLLVYAIYQRARGRCYNCSSNEALLYKYKTGQLKHISPTMVKDREKWMASESIRTGADDDLEMGHLSYAEKRDKDREEALAALNGPEPVKSSIWDRAKGVAGIVESRAKDVAGAVKTKAKGKGKQPASIPPEPDAERTIGGPVYTETPVESVRHIPRPLQQVQNYDEDSYYDRAYDAPSPPDNVRNPPSPPSPSIYSRPGASDVGGRIQDQAEHYILYGPPLRDTSPDQPTTTYSTYLEAQKKRRSRTYGGLPNPEGFEDVDIGGGR